MANHQCLAKTPVDDPGWPAGFTNELIKQAENAAKAYALVNTRDNWRQLRVIFFLTALYLTNTQVY